MAAAARNSTRPESAWRDRTPHGIVPALLVAGLASVSPLDAAVVDPAPLRLSVEQGTDIALAVMRDATLVAQIAGRLWKLPAEGGEAEAITAPEEIARRPAIGPDGRRIAFEVLRDGSYQVASAAPDGADFQVLTQGPWQNLMPSWSSDGKRLAFASNRGGDFAIWELDPATGDTRQLSFEPGDEFDPAWSPDGGELAYIGEARGQSALILRRPGQPPRTVARHPGAMRAPSWRPDGSVISYVESSPRGPRLQMAILSEPPIVKPLIADEDTTPAPVAWLDRQTMFYAAGGSIRRREFGAPRATTVPFRADLRVARRNGPTNRRLPQFEAGQVVRGFGGLAVLPGGRVVTAALGDLWEFDDGGQLLRAVTADAAEDTEPATTADGKRLAFVSDRSGSPQLWLLDNDTGEFVQLTRESEAVMHPAWSRRGDRLAYLAGPVGATRGMLLKVIAPRTSGTLTVADELTRAPIAWSGDDAWIGLIEADAGAPRLTLVAADGSGARRRVTLPTQVAAGAPAAATLDWAPDGKSVLVASSAGLRVLPVTASGLVGVDWRSLGDHPVQRALWADEAGAVVFADAEGLARADATGTVSRIPITLSWRTDPPPGRSVIRASRVFDGVSPRYLYNHEVVVEGGRIVAVQPWGATPPVTGQKDVDARNKTVMPGLIEAAAVLATAPGENAAARFLAWGVTTVHALSPEAAELLPLAERWQAQRAGPRLLASRTWCSPTLDGDRMVAPILPGAVRLCPATPAAAPLLARAARDTGAGVWSSDWLAATSGAIDAVGPFPGRYRGFRDRYYQDAIDVLLESGTALVSGLAGGALPLLLGDHPDLLDGRQAQALFGPGKRAKLREPAGEAVDPGIRQWMRERRRLLGRMAAGGGVVAAGSVSAGVFGLGLHAEIRALAEPGGGLDPPQVLRAATTGAAAALGLAGEIGGLSAGQSADLLIVDGDPLADLADLLRVDAVMVRGELRSLAELLPAPPEALEKFTRQTGSGSGKPSRKRR